MPDLKILKKLSEAFGPSSQEDDVLQIIREELKDGYEFVQTTHKNLIVRPPRRDRLKTIVLQAHTDELGFRPYRYLPSGFVELSPTCPEVPECAANQPLVFQPGGARGILILGQIGGRRRYYVDLGARDPEEARAMVPRHANGAYLGYPMEESPTQLLGKCLDDRAGVAAIVQVLKDWAPEAPNRLVGLFTAREETGNWPVPELHRVMLAEELVPDLIVNVEVCPGGPTPVEAEPIASLGQGVVLVHMDASYAPDSSVCAFMDELMVGRGVHHQHISMRAGSGELGRLALGFGVAGYPLTIPCRYMHCPRSVIAKADYEACINALQEIALAY